MHRITKSLEAFLRNSTPLRPREISISFQPYTRLRNTIRIRDHVLQLRLSDGLQDAPHEVLSALAILLACKLVRIPPPAECAVTYRAYIRRPEIRSRAEEIRRQRGRKRMLPAAGNNFDLRELFEGLNREYFDGRLAVRHLGWSTRQARRTLGHYDPAHDAIVINRRLDNPLVPEYVVSSVLHHEMLHALQASAPGRRIHDATFRRAEKRFADYRRAQRFIAKHFR